MGAVGKPSSWVMAGTPHQRRQSIMVIVSKDEGVLTGFAYFAVSSTLTGSGALDTAAVEAMLPRIRQHIDIPVGVGFGIRDPQTARAIGQVADAVVIGTRLIQIVGELPREGVVPAAVQFLGEIRQALDA